MSANLKKYTSAAVRKVTTPVGLLEHSVKSREASRPIAVLLGLTLIAAISLAVPLLLMAYCALWEDDATLWQNLHPALVFLRAFTIFATTVGSYFCITSVQSILRQLKYGGSSFSWTGMPSVGSVFGGVVKTSCKLGEKMFQVRLVCNELEKYYHAAETYGDNSSSRSSYRTSRTVVWKGRRYFRSLAAGNSATAIPIVVEIPKQLPATKPLDRGESLGAEWILEVESVGGSGSFKSSFVVPILMSKETQPTDTAMLENLSTYACNIEDFEEWGIESGAKIRNAGDTRIYESGRDWFNIELSLMYSLGLLVAMVFLAIVGAWVHFALCLALIGLMSRIVVTKSWPQRTISVNLAELVVNGIVYSVRNIISLEPISQDDWDKRNDAKNAPEDGHLLDLNASSFNIVAHLQNHDEPVIVMSGIAGLKFAHAVAADMRTSLGIN